MHFSRSWRIASALAVTVLLSGCASWDNITSIVGGDDTSEASAQMANAAPAAAPAPAESETGFCRAVADQAREQATTDLYDRATQQRRYDVTYRQCIATGSDQ